MARTDRESDYKRNERNVKKADIIIDLDKEISAKVDDLYGELRKTNAKIDALLGERTGKDGTDGGSYASLHDEIKSLRRELDFIAAQNASVFTELKRIIRDWAGISPNRSYQTSRGQAELDYDKLAGKIADILPVQEQISAEYIACKVAEQIVIPDGVSPSPAAKESSPQPYTVTGPVNLNIDEEELADRVALKVGSIKAEDFDILVDDDGCSSISEEIVNKLDYDSISAAVAEKLRSALSYAEDTADYEEMAAKISEKITVAGINEDAIADKAAAALSNYLPEMDADEIADKVAEQILHGMSGVVDSETISKNISDKLIETQENHEYDIVIDDEGIGKITEYVSGEVNKNVDGRFDGVNRKIDELKALIAGGVLLKSSSREAVRDDGLVTVSEVVENKDDSADDAAGETGEGISDAALLGVMVEELSEETAEGEVTDDLVTGNAAVDFEHMMKYNRSFIARIIQSSDEQKDYYGRIKTALLSYAKVNSSLGWSSERFNKGRETVARLKIRGKTLCLYLALAPSEYKTSVYHHVDVSDNKSMRGTPLMVKIKSPLGVKKAIRLIDEMLEAMGAIKRNKATERDYAAMYPYESIEELIEDGLVKEVDKN